MVQRFKNPGTFNEFDRLVNGQRIKIRIPSRLSRGRCRRLPIQTREVTIGDIGSTSGTLFSSNMRRALAAAKSGKSAPAPATTQPPLTPIQQATKKVKVSWGVRQVSQHFSDKRKPQEQAWVKYSDGTESVHPNAPIGTYSFDKSGNLLKVIAPVITETPESYAAQNKIWAPGTRSHGMPINPLLPPQHADDSCSLGPYVPPPVTPLTPPVYSIPPQDSFLPAPIVPATVVSAPASPLSFLTNITPKNKKLMMFGGAALIGLLVIVVVTKKKSAPRPYYPPQQPQQPRY